MLDLVFSLGFRWKKCQDRVPRVEILKSRNMEIILTMQNDFDPSGIEPGTFGLICCVLATRQRRLVFLNRALKRLILILTKTVILDNSKSKSELCLKSIRNEELVFQTTGRTKTFLTS